MKLLIFLALWFTISPLFANNSTIEPIYERFDDNSMKIESLYEDSYGFIWIGSSKGVIKYDGLNYSQLSVATDNDKTITLGFTYSFAQLSDEILLIGTHSQGLIIYDYTTNKLSVFPLPNIKTHISTSEIFDIAIDSNSNAYITIGNDILILNKDLEYIGDISTDGIRKPEYWDIVFDIHISPQGDIFCSLPTSGIFKINKDLSGFTKIFPTDEEQLEDEMYYRIRERENGNLLFSTRRSGLIEITKKGKLINKTIIFEHKEDVEFWAICIQNDTAYCGGINAGVIYMDLKTGKKTELQMHPSIENSKLPVTSIISDQYSNIWVGTHVPGLFKINRHKQFNSQFPNQPVNWLSDQLVNCFTEADSVLWIGTDGEAIFYYDKKTEKYGQLTTDDGLSSDVVLSMEVDNKNNLWLSTWNGGLSYLDTESKKAEILKPIPGNENSLTFSNIKTSALINDTLWIPTHGKGVNIYIPDTKSFISNNNTPYNLLKPIYGTDIYKCSQGYVWIATTGGLFAYYQNETLQFLTKDSIGLYDDYINELFEDNQNRLWIGTNTGLQYFDKKRSTITRISTAIIPKGAVSIISKSDNELFIATQDGLYLFNTNNQTAINYNQNDGLASRFFRDRAVFKTANGTIFWGHDKGFSYYHPTTKATKNLTPTILVNSLEVKNAYNEDLGQYFNVLSDTSIRLPYDHTTIKIRFTATGVPDAHRIKFSYKLEGQDELYQDADGFEVFYSRLEPGKYKLHIKGDYQNASTERIITIHIQSPFWATAWFRILVGVIIISLLIFFYAYRIQLLKKKRFEQLVREKTHELEEKNNQLQLQTQDLEAAHEELKVQSEQLVESNEELQNINKTQNQLMSILAHDLKNNFNVVIGFTDLLLVNKSKIDKYLPLINKGVFRAYSLLNNLLQWASSQGDRIELHFQDLRIKTLAKRVIEQNISIAKAKQIELKIEIGEHIAINADSNTLENVLRNLIQNAIKFSQKKSEVIISAKVAGNNAIISVKDFGVGMDQESLNQVFTATFSTTGTDHETGTGLGLALCKDFTERNRGTIEIESTLGVGTTISLTFKAVKLPQEESTQQENANLTDTSTEEFNISNLTKQDEKILLVEDNNMLRMQLHAQLSNYFTIETAENGIIALEKVKTFTPSVIITDLEMPQMRGDEFCKKIKTNKQTGHIPVIMLTAMNTKENYKAGMEAGADAFIDKVQGIESLVLKTLNILSTRQKLKESILINTKVEENSSEINVKDGLLKKLYDIIEKNYADPSFSVEILAEQIGYNRSHLYKKTKEISSYTPSEIILQFRLEKAKTLLASGFYSVTEVAYMTGFNSSGYFSRKFKSHFNVVPSQFNGK